MDRKHERTLCWQFVVTQIRHRRFSFGESASETPQPKQCRWGWCASNDSLLHFVWWENWLSTPRAAPKMWHLWSSAWQKSGIQRRARAATLLQHSHVTIRRRACPWVRTSRDSPTPLSSWRRSPSEVERIEKCGTSQ